jgi:hypothetical protein
MRRIFILFASTGLSLAALSAAAIAQKAADPAKDPKAAYTPTLSEDANRELLIKALPDHDGAKAAAAAGDHVKAVAGFTKAIGTYPRFADAYIGRAFSHLERKAYPAAAADLTRAIELQPPLSAQDKADAKTPSAGSMALKPQHYLASLYFNRAVAYANGGTYDKAIADGGAVLELNPFNTSVYRLRANAYFQLKDFDKSLADLARAVEADPKDIQLYRMRASIHYNRKAYDKSIPDFTRVIAEKPDDLDLYKVRGIAYLETKDFAKAARDFERVLDKAPDDKNMGNALRQALQRGLRDEPFTARLVRLADAACEPSCPEWISLQGDIREGTAGQVKALLDGLGSRKPLVFVDSGGGLMDQGLEIARLIRARGLDVVVGRTEFSDCTAGDAACKARTAGGRHLGRPLAAGTMCASSCAFLVAAGTKRYVGAPATVGVHQAWNVTAKKPSDDRAYIEAFEFFREMGIDKSIMTILIKEPPKGMTWLSPAELASTRIRTDAANAVELLRRGAIARAPLAP